jgi:hypothetical protein
MSKIIVNNSVYTIYKTYEAALGIVLCFIQPQESGETHTLMLTPDGDWKFTGSQAGSLKDFEQTISNAIMKLTEDYPICYS